METALPHHVGEPQAMGLPWPFRKPLPVPCVSPQLLLDVWKHPARSVPVQGLVVGHTGRKEERALAKLLWQGDAQTKQGDAQTRLWAGRATCLDVNAAGRLSGAQWSTKHAHNG